MLTSRCFTSSTRIHVMALDGIVNVNSLFTVALFLGLTATTSTTSTANTSSSAGSSAASSDRGTSCAASTAVVENLVVFHVYAFSAFLFSSLVALALKQAIRINSTEEGGKDDDDGGGDYGDGDTVAVVGGETVGRLNTAAYKVGMVVSTVGSVLGSGFLVAALVSLVQMKLGKLGCGGWYTVAAIAPLLVLVPMALVLYLCIAFYAFMLC